MNLSGTGSNQPGDGVEFKARGAYGSTVHDDGEGFCLVINVCDDCLVGASKEDLVGQQEVSIHGDTEQKPITAWSPPS